MYDPLERLTGYTSPASTVTAYGWDKVPNRTSVQVGAGSPVATTYDAANRPQNQNGVSGAYTSDADGRLTTQPTSAGAGFQRYEWDSLGRLTKVRPATGGSTTATYTYDPLDRLRLADYGGSNRVRFRSVGLTTSVAQTIDDKTGAVSRNIGTGWGGERQLDWTGTSSNIRYHGTNAHHDTVWTANSTGSVSATLRYDPWGQLTASTGASLPDFRFQGSWHDTTTSIAWVITRWYAPALGRFLSEDSLLGTPSDPPSRHLYAYAEGNPIAGWDPDGRWTRPWSYYKTSYRDWHSVALTVYNVSMYAACTLGAKVDVGWGTRCGAITFFLTMEDKFRLFTITTYYYRVAANQVKVVDRRAVRIQSLTTTRWVFERYSDNRVYTQPYLRGCLGSIQLGALRTGNWACGSYWYDFKRYYW